MLPFDSKYEKCYLRLITKFFKNSREKRELMNIKKKCFGLLSNGKTAELFIVDNGRMSFSATNYGCCITSIFLPSKNGGFDDVVLGYSTLSDYMNNSRHFGSLIGRCAGRISNAEFTLGSQQYLLTPNENGIHCLHSGYPSYGKQLWDAAPFRTEHEAGITFSRISCDKEQGFPGSLSVSVTYSLSTDNELTLLYEAETDKTTPIDLTNHTYFNLNPPGMRAGGSYVSVLNHEVQIFADQYLHCGNDLIPTGKLADVKDSPYDFRTPKLLEQDMKMLKTGYDGTWVIKKEMNDQKALAAIIREPVTGRSITIYSTQIGFTMNTANSLDGEIGKNGDIYNAFSGLCLQSQHFPDAVHNKNFPSCLLKQGEKYCQKTVWLFGF